MRDDGSRSLRIRCVSGPVGGAGKRGEKAGANAVVSTARTSRSWECANDRAQWLRQDLGPRDIRAPGRAAHPPSWLTIVS